MKGKGKSTKTSKCHEIMSHKCSCDDFSGKYFCTARKCRNDNPAIRPVGSTMSLSASQLWEQDYMVYHASDPERVVRLTMKDIQLSDDM